jgi:hypothetical protein
MENKQIEHRPLYLYAGTIKRDWQNLDAAAKPYVAAMYNLDQITDAYGADSANEIVRRFLCNARGWRGQVARDTKAELKRIAGVK